MKLKSLRARGIGAIRESSLPIEQLNGTDRIVAIRGVNGSGKTTHIECLPGALYGTVPSHGKLNDMANDAGSYVDAVIETDQAYRLQRAINANRKRPTVEAYIFDSDGTPLNDGKQSTFDEMVAQLFPARDLYLASGFLAQTRGNQFLELPKSDRRRLFGEMLGIGYLQRLSEAAGVRAKSYADSITRLTGTRDHLRSTADEVHALTERVDAATLVKSSASDDLAEAIELDKKRAARFDEWSEYEKQLSNAIRDAESDVAVARQALQKAEAENTTITADITKLEAELRRLYSRMESEPKLRELVGFGDAARLKIRDLEDERDRLAKDRDDWASEHRMWSATEVRLRNALDSARTTYKSAVSDAERKLSELREQSVQLKAHASKLDGVPCHGDGEFESCPLIAMATGARDKLDGIDALISGAEAELELAKNDTGTGETLKAELEEHMKLEPKEPARFSRDAELESSRSLAVKGETAAVELAALSEVALQIEQTETRGNELCSRQARVDDEIVTLGKRLDEATTMRANAMDEWSAHQNTKPGQRDDILLETLRTAEADAVAELARAQEALDSSRAALVKLADIEAEISSASAEVDDWRHLQKAFGAEGIQALEIDAAGPEVSELINTLLHSCFGSRFSARLQTTALKADGKGTKEIFDLVVIDSEKGREGSASDLSGGERVIVAEALSLAIAIYNARKSSTPILDLIRDEVAGALDEDNARRYLAMLRGALEIGGFHRIYFIAHQPDLWGLSDATIVVDAGVASIEE